MDLQLTGKTAAVMAASKGLGRAAAEALAGEGANVVLCARDAKTLDATAKALRKRFPKVKVEIVVADVAKPADLQRFIEAAVKVGGGTLDVLVTNNGGPKPGMFGDLSDADWTAAYELIVLSVVRAVRHALPALQKAKGVVINIASTSVKQPLPSLVLSNSLRMAVVGLAKTLATQLATMGVRVNTVCPGLYETDRIVELAEFQAKQRGLSLQTVMAERTQEIPVGRMGRPDELGHVIAFLASARASYVTGSTISVDGGIVRSTFG